MIQKIKIHFYKYLNLGYDLRTVDNNKIQLSTYQISKEYRDWYTFFWKGTLQKVHENLNIPTFDPEILLSEINFKEVICILCPIEIT